jgi:hypothetical protein
MPSINTPDTGHVVDGVFRAHGHLKEFQFLPFTERRYLDVLRAAFSVIDARIRSHAPCNAAFRALPGHRSFAEVWADPTVWINFDPGLTPGYYGGKAIGYPPNITITAHTLSRGRWWTAAILIHELAHVNGAPGARAGAHALDAERVLIPCLLKDFFDPNILGQLSNPRAARFA